MIFIYREEMTGDEAAPSSPAELHITKQRNGLLGVVRVPFDAPTTRFRNLSGL